MATPRVKIVKKDGAAVSDFEKRVAAEISQLESTHATLKSELKHLHISAAREVDIDATRKAALVFVPFPMLNDFRKIQKTLVEELEKKLSGYHVLIIANRTMISPKSWARSSKFTGVRSRTRSLRAVQENLLDDIVYPTEITGKRIRVSVDGSRLLKVHLSHKNDVEASGKLDTFRSVYKKMTNKDIDFVLGSTN